MTLFASEEPVPDKPVRDRCAVCHHKLQDPVSQAYGIGPDCRAALGITGTPRLSRFARVRAGGDVEGQGDLLAGEAEE